MSRFFQGYYDSSDDGVMDDDGFVSIMARSDDVINVSGHRISTKALEEVREVPLLRRGVQWRQLLAYN